MTHVAQGSSDVGSSKAIAKPVVFDIATEVGMLTLLRTIHRSAVKQKVKNELRDLLFGLRQAEDDDKDPVIKALEEAGFKASFGIAVDENSSASIAPVKKNPSSLGRMRNIPRFAPVSVTPQVKKEEAVTQTPVIAPEVKTPNQQPAPIPEPDPEPEITKPSVEVKVAVTPETVDSPAAQPPVTPEKPTAPVDDPMIRIKEIKRLVNEKIGNPITLIDTDNKVGREYMNSLLAAMKTANGGNAAEKSAAMERLEKAYLEAIRVAENAPPPETQTDKFVKDTSSQNAPVKDEPLASGFNAPAEPVVKSEAPPVVEPVIEKADEPTPPMPPSSASESAPADSQAGAMPVKLNVASAIVNDNPAVDSSPKTEPVPVEVEEPVPSIPVINKATTPPVVKDIIQPQTKAPTEPEAVAVDASVPSPAGTPTETDPSSKLMSVAKEEQLQNLMRHNQEKDAEQAKSSDEQVRSSTDPLMQSEVTAGLKQLLSEWSLFKSSGFFGTGPGGADHPLYAKMSAQTMSAIIAGRFEGATPQVKQSVTDYMNGWRYEEGIVHEHTETFETYLRRVIRHILDNKDTPKLDS